MKQLLTGCRPTAWLAFLVMCVFVMSGCSAKQGFSHTPTEEAEFYKPLGELKQNYSDIEEYDRILARPSSSPKKDDLQKKWGEPEVKKKWIRYLAEVGLCVGLAVGGWISYPALGAIYLLAPTPQEEYVWKKGNYEITAQGRSDIFVGYEERIRSWEWKEINKQEAAQQTGE